MRLDLNGITIDFLLTLKFGIIILNSAIQKAFEFEIKLKDLLSLPTLYEIKHGVRFLRGTNKLVSERLHILCFDRNYKKLSFSSISECSKALNIDRSTIKKYLITGKFFNNYKFILNY